MKPLCIDLFCGLGGWTEGFLAEGWDVVGFDIERHVYGDQKYPSQLVLQDVMTIHGSQFKGADCLVSSPPCQEYSYMAMPWTLAKKKRARILADAEEQKRLTALFDACFRIQEEASEAAGRHIPLVVENVKGAQPWVGRAAWHFGSFYLWGDIPALMPMTNKRFHKIDAPHLHLGDPRCPTGSAARMRYEERKNSGGSWFGIGSPGQKEVNRNPTKHPLRTGSSKSNARKAASAAIAKIPFVLAQHIARAWKPEKAVLK